MSWDKKVWDSKEDFRNSFWQFANCVTFIAYSSFAVYSLDVLDVLDVEKVEYERERQINLKLQNPNIFAILQKRSVSNFWLEDCISQYFQIYLSYSNKDLFPIFLIEDCISLMRQFDLTDYSPVRYAKF